MTSSTITSDEMTTTSMVDMSSGALKETQEFRRNTLSEVQVGEPARVHDGVHVTEHMNIATTRQQCTRRTCHQYRSEAILHARTKVNMLLNECTPKRQDNDVHVELVTSVIRKEILHALTMVSMLPNTCTPYQLHNDVQEGHASSVNW